MTASQEFADRSRPKQDRPIGSLLAGLTREVATLFRQEIALAKAEAAEKVGRLRGGVVLSAGGAIILLCGLLALLESAILGLSTILEPWLAALIAGGVVLLIGAILLLVGARRFQADSLVPRRTIQSLKDDRAWAREQMR